MANRRNGWSGDAEFTMAGNDKSLLMAELT